MEISTIPLPADVEYWLDSALEHDEIDGSTHIALKLYANRSDLMRILDDEYKFDGIGSIKPRLARCAAVTSLADAILAELPDDKRGPIAWAGVQHMRFTVQATANNLATWAHEDQICGGCMLPYKRPRNLTEQRRMSAMQLSPRQRRQLYGRNWIRRYVTRAEEADRLRGLGLRVTARLRGVDRHSAKSQAEQLASDLQAQHEGYRRHNERQIMLYTGSLRLRDTRAGRKQKRKIIGKALVCAESVLGSQKVREFTDGRAVYIEGQAIALEIGRIGSSSTIGHSGLRIVAVELGSKRRLANLCVYHENTPALDQLTALALGMQAGEEEDIIATANLSQVTAAGLAHPLIADRGKDHAEQPWRPRDHRAQANETYWQATKPIWIEALGVHALGRAWSVTA